MAQASEFIAAQKAILRKDAPAEAAVRASSGASIDEYIEELIERAASSTEPALIMANAIEGKVPSEERLTSLAEFAQEQFDHYSALGVAHPELGPYEALGRSLSGTEGFHAQSAGKSDRDFIVSVWTQANVPSPGTGPSEAVVQHYLAQILHFQERYHRIGLSVSDSSNWARGAVYGQIYGVLASAKDSHLTSPSKHFLKGAAMGRSRFNAPLLNS